MSTIGDTLGTTLLGCVSRSALLTGPETADILMRPRKIPFSGASLSGPGHRTRVETAMDAPRNFFDVTRQELAAWFLEHGQPRYRADQVCAAVYRRGMADFEAMTDLPKGLRADLAAAWTLAPLAEVRRIQSPDGSARKFLWRLADQRQIEGVLMEAEYGETICFSTQVGCAFRCSFCITGKMGRIRNLTPGEIVAQIWAVERLRAGENPAASGAESADPRPGANLVAMGMGEPLDNYEALAKAVGILQDPLGMNVSGRRITVSTVGVAPGIERLAREIPSVRLALSLNATTDAVRSTLMPITRKYPIEQVLQAVETFARASGRRVTLEYVLIRGLNDTPEDAERLGRMAERFPSKLNIIPFNPSDLFTYERPSPEEVDAFAHRLWRFRTTVTVRYSKGLDILAACGQLGYDQVKDSLAAEA